MCGAKSLVGPSGPPWAGGGHVWNPVTNVRGVHAALGRATRPNGTPRHGRETILSGICPAELRCVAWCFSLSRMSKLTLLSCDVTPAYTLRRTHTLNKTNRHALLSVLQPASNHHMIA